MAYDLWESVWGCRLSSVRKEDVSNPSSFKTLPSITRVTDFNEFVTIDKSEKV